MENFRARLTVSTERSAEPAHSDDAPDTIARLGRRGHRIEGSLNSAWIGATCPTKSLSGSIGFDLSGAFPAFGSQRSGYLHVWKCSSPHYRFPQLHNRLTWP